MNKDDVIASVRQYLSETIEDYDLKSELAWRDIGRMRCPVPETLSSAIQDRVEEWVEDFGEDYGIADSQVFWDEFSEEDCLM